MPITATTVPFIKALVVVFVPVVYLVFVTGVVTGFSNAATTEVVKNVKEQLQLNLDWKDNERSAILMMRRHFAKYFPGLPDFRELKIKLLRAETNADVINILDKIEEKYGELKPDYQE